MDKFKSMKIVSILGIIGNLFLFIIKALGGFLTNSEALIGDAFNSLSDIFSSLMTFIGSKIASKPIDDDHNLGHGKAEYIYSLFISIIMFFLALTLFKDSLIGLIHKNTLIYSYWLIIICLVTIIIKLGLYFYALFNYKKNNSLLIKAAYKDHRNDIVITFFNLIAIILSQKGYFFFDGMMGIIIAIWIFISGIEIFKNSYDVLMDKSINEETKNKVLEIIANHPEVKKVDHFNSTPIGYRYQISFSIFVDGNLATFESHAIADTLEKEINEKVPEVYLTVIHVNPLIKD